MTAAIALASLMVATASLALSLWSLKVCREADFNSAVLQSEMEGLRYHVRNSRGDTRWNGPAVEKAA